MSGVSFLEPEARYSAPWYTNIDVALMGIQSTAQFVEKYHHIIGLDTVSSAKDLSEWRECDYRIAWHAPYTFESVCDEVGPIFHQEDSRGANARSQPVHSRKGQRPWGRISY
ncbi:hypothetical protein KM043_003725 [Ampulex compressa]|nr:hypothetical protein KM043_003725 [Ampulex compressa]